MNSVCTRPPSAGQSATSGCGCPRAEVVELARLFGKGVAARAALRLLLDRRPTRPSDARLQQELADKGTDIARRTVTKYRHGLHCG